jgi:methylthioribose-1-phosphate isomerase
MKNNRLQKFESKTASEPSPEQIKQARETAVNMIMAVYDRMPKDNIQPVKESFLELGRQAREGVHRQSTIIQTSESDTKIISGGSLEVPKKSTDIDIEVPQKFTDFEMELLRKIQNGE